MNDLGTFKGVINLNGIPNQFVVSFEKGRVFQSYNSIIAVLEDGKTTLGPDWAYSSTTSRHRAKFLGESTSETQAKIDAGEYTIDINL